MSERLLRHDFYAHQWRVRFLKLSAHILEKGWRFLIRIQDKENSKGIASGLDLPNAKEFDLTVDLSLTTKQTNEVKKLAENRNQYKILRDGRDFDYLPSKNRKHDPTVFYRLPFRIVRFRIVDGVYETLVINLDRRSFPASELRGSTICDGGLKPHSVS